MNNKNVLCVKTDSILVREYVVKMGFICKKLIIFIDVYKIL